MNIKVPPFERKIINFFRRMSISWRLMLCLSILLSVQMAVIGWFSYNLVSTYLRNTFLKKIEETNYTIKEQSNFIRKKYEDISDGILANPTIQANLQKYYGTDLSTQMLSDKSGIEDILTNPDDSLYATIITKSRNVYQSNSGRYISALYNSLVHSKVYNYSLTSEGENLWIMYDENIMSGYKEPSLYVCRTLRSLQPRNRILGQLIIQVPIDILDNVFRQSKLDNGEFYAILNSNGDYLYHTGDMNLAGKKADKEIVSLLNEQTDGYRIIKKGNEALILSYSIFSVYEEKGWSIIHVVPMNSILSNARTVSNVIIVVMFITLLSILPFLVLLSRSISRPVHKLKLAVEQFGKGNLKARTPANRMDEIGHLQVSFNGMADDINRLLQKNELENRHRRLLELNMLEYQVNPHFLYNTLDSINWMAQKAGKEDIGQLAGSLARFFRIGLSKGNEFYKVKDELEHVEQYLLINKIRYKDCFNYQITSDHDILEHYTIKFVLQPVVENAIKYGIDKRGKDGYISVSVKRDDNSLLFEITDNGEGIPDDRLKAIRSSLERRTAISEESENIGNPEVSGSGFGLFNLSQRIWLNFGNEYGIAISNAVQKSSEEESRDFSGALVRIRLPLLPKIP